ncbi:hypothetical protein HQ544_03525, partial [Candidatus Falkowbacteria bacterium]|nr:hypothetical protein [Candidatus Falkowbacteria bacterium]
MSKGKLCKEGGTVMVGVGVQMVMAERTRKMEERNALTSDIQAWMGGPKEEELEAFLAGQERWQPMMANGGMNIINALT